MRILSIDTTTRGCSVAVHQDGALVASYDLLTDRSSSAMLTTLMQNAVEHAGFTLPELDAVAIAKGPGSYTGLRVGVSTAKGLCYALDKPLIAISSLEALTAQITAFYPKDYLFCPMIDARRMEVFASVYTAGLDVIQPTQALIIEEDSFRDLLQEHSIVFFGDGAAKCEPVLGNHPKACFPTQPIEPSARTIGVLAAIAYKAGQFEDLASFEPYYLKDFMGTKPRKKIVNS